MFIFDIEIDKWNVARWSREKRRELEAMTS